MNLKSYLWVWMSICTMGLSAQNLIKDADFDEPLPNPEIRVSTYPKMAKKSIFTEDDSENKCLKLEVLANPVNSKTKKPFHFQRVYIGGKQGIEVKPNTVYSYSIALKGNVAPRVFIEERAGDVKKKVGLNTIKDLSTEDWKVVKGTFKTGSDATRVVLCVDIVGYVAATLPEIGSYLLIDKASLTEKK